MKPSGVFIVNFEDISHMVMVLQLPTLSIEIVARQDLLKYIFEKYFIVDFGKWICSVENQSNFKHC